MKIALVYNGVTRDMLLQGPLDRTAEFDGPHTVAALREALAVHGHAVTLIEANEEAYERLRTSGVVLPKASAERTARPRFLPCWKCWACPIQAQGHCPLP